LRQKKNSIAFSKFCHDVCRKSGKHPAKTTSFSISFSTNILSLAGQLQQEQDSIEQEKNQQEQEY